jgi:hypothetical protein
MPPLLLLLLPQTDRPPREDGCTHSDMVLGE